jgi:hypothetical protein
MSIFMYFLSLHPNVCMRIHSFPAAAGSAELVEVLSNSVFAPIGGNPSPRTFASICDGISGLSSRSSPRCLTSPSCFNASPDDTPSVSSNGGSAALSPAVFHRLSLASPWPVASSPAIFPPAPWVSSGTLGPPFDTCSDSVETGVGCDLLSPFDYSTNLGDNSNGAMPCSNFEESFDASSSGRTQFSQAVTASNPGTPAVFDSSSRLKFGCALVRGSSYGELSWLADATDTPSPVHFLPARSMSASTISSTLELHKSSGSGGLSFLFYKRSRDGLNTVSAQTLASMMRGGSNVDPPLLCSSSAELCVLRPGASCPLSQQLSAQPRFTVVDARYDFEFGGGHIEGALNINKDSDLQEYFFGQHVRAQREGSPMPPPPPPSEHVYVFHCEYSQKRGPWLLKVKSVLEFVIFVAYAHLQRLREIDRRFNQYPTLSYPHLYILDEGYKNFFETHSYCCDGGYIPMKDQLYKTDLAIAKKECCQKRAKTSSVRYFNLASNLFTCFHIYRNSIAALQRFPRFVILEVKKVVLRNWIHLLDVLALLRNFLLISHFFMCSMEVNLVLQKCVLRLF